MAAQLSPSSSTFLASLDARMKAAQDAITDFLHRVSPTQRCLEDHWLYDKGSGGGRTRVWESADDLIEKGGVNFSHIVGDSLPESAATAFNIPSGTRYVAMGVSLVIHPRNPYIPTIHMNVRYFEAAPPPVADPQQTQPESPKWWFGGGIDLTPYYPCARDVVQFHRSLRDLCERHDEPYSTYKNLCDEYFTVRHRNKEMRGCGGIFFDHQHKKEKEQIVAFILDLAHSFESLYAPFWALYAQMPFGAAEREWQLVRRGFYVEFNLLWDRGTKFGIASGGRTESILMSLPRVAEWRYSYSGLINAGGKVEKEVRTWYYHPQDWAAGVADSPILSANLRETIKPWSLSHRAHQPVPLQQQQQQQHSPAKAPAFASAAVLGGAGMRPLQLVSWLVAAFAAGIGVGQLLRWRS